MTSSADSVASTVDPVRGQIVDAARRLAAQGLVIGTTGNVSARIAGRVWITPTRTPYAALRPDDLAGVEVASGRRLSAATPSMELPLHLAVYRTRSDVRAVVHTHSPHATAWSFLDRPLAPTTEDLTYHGLGPVETCAGGPPGTQALATSVGRALRSEHAVLVAGHGVVAVGDTVELAVARAAAVEHVAQIAWLLRHEALPAVHRQR
ncbi:MAG: class aldolase/adducin family protein [Conexibacter sp.]|nr:class aldolase/adducin family protein [Conexibacter sp.]